MALLSQEQHAQIEAIIEEKLKTQEDDISSKINTVIGHAGEVCARLTVDKKKSKTLHEIEVAASADNGRTTERRMEDGGWWWALGRSSPRASHSEEKYN